jgi:pimeloyl-ACP methyl ester carboxylesterase
MARSSPAAPVPPREMPPARTVVVPGRGEFFVRDTALAPAGSGCGGTGGARDGAGPAAATEAGRPPVLLLHGWVVSADLNWHAAYDALAQAGHRVIALDHRGHGRGLRAPARFRLEDCAADAAAVVRALGAPRAIVVGYSMGGTIAQLMAREHRELVAGLVLSGTCQHFQDPETRRAWRWMGMMGVAIGLAPRTFYRAGFRRNGLRLDGELGAWTVGELMRHEARDVAEAGRELGRFDSRPWLPAVDVPAAMVLTAHDSAVAPAKQRELASACRIPFERQFEVPLDHMELTARPEVYNPALLAAITSLDGAAEVSAG